MVEIFAHGPEAHQGFMDLSPAAASPAVQYYDLFCKTILKPPDLDAAVEKMSGYRLKD